MTIPPDLAVLLADLRALDWATLSPNAQADAWALLLRALPPGALPLYGTIELTFDKGHLALVETVPRVRGVPRRAS